ncbi:MAG: hypothetical protein LBG27_08735 [Spirochaetaceae bacterium]|nr:hypothetical protein [Spirochaetaceae bacterium]
MFALDVGNGLTIAGEVKTGIRADSVDDGNEDTAYDTKVRGFNNDADKDFRTRLTVTYSGDWGGAKIRFQSLSFGGDTTAPFTTKYAYGWANLLDSKIVLSGGVIGDDLWGLGKLGANVFDPSVDAITGVRAEFKIVDGLSFGGGLVVKEALTIDHAFGGWVVGGLYKSSLISAALGVALKPGTDDVAAGEDSYGWKDDDDDPSTVDTWELIAGSPAIPGYDPWFDAIVGIEVNPIDALKVVVDGRFDTRKYAKQGKIGYSRFGLKGIFTAGKLSAHLQGDFTVQNEAPESDGAHKGKLENINDVWTTIVSSDYERTNVPVEALGDPIVAFRIGADYKITDPINAYIQIGSDNVAWFAGQEKDGADPYIAGAGLYIKPGIKITLGSSSIEIFDKINKIGAVSWKNAKNDDVSPIANQFQVDFNWSF